MAIVATTGHKAKGRNALNAGMAKVASGAYDCCKHLILDENLLWER
jgi:hypothetical protein